MKRRILFVADCPQLIGINARLNSLVRSLAREDNEIRVIVPSQARNRQLWFPESVARIESIDPRAPWLNRLLQLRRQIFEFDPDLLHAWGNEAQLSTMLASIGHARSEKFASFFEIPARGSSIRRQTARSLFRKQRVRVIASHRSIADELVAEGFDIPIVVIPHGVVNVGNQRDQARDRLLQLIGQQNSSVYLIGAVSRFSPAYRLKDLVWATDLLCCVRDDLHLLIFGSGTGAGMLRRFISKTASSRHIHFVPPAMMSESNLAGLDVYWNAQVEEPIPATMLTAMSLAIPVVSVLDRGTAELVLPLRTALATNFAARDEFARWTKYLIEQQESADLLARQGRIHAEKTFPVQKMIDGYNRLYSTTR